MEISEDHFGIWVACVRLWSGAKGLAELVVGKARRDFGADPEAFVIGTCLDASFNAAENTSEEYISIVLDLGRRSAPLEDWIKRGTAAYSGPVKPMGISFQPVAKVPGLQAADTIATEAYWRAVASLDDDDPAVSAHFRSLCENTPTIVRVLRRQDIAALVKRVNKA